MGYTRDEVLLSVENVTQRYGTKEVLSDISVQVHNLHSDGIVAGQVVAILGPSGCGKTQLIRTIAGLQKPTLGGVFIDPDRKPTHRGMVGVVFQSYPLFNHRTIESNMELAGTLAGMSTAQAKERAEYYLSLFGLLDCARNYPCEVSGGMRQRVAVSQQLMNLDESKAKTKLVLLDEPFAALDYLNTRKTCQLVRKAADLSDLNTIILVTHDIRAALLASDIIWIMNKGRIVREIDVLAAGLTWHEELEGSPCFLEMEKGIIATFNDFQATR